MTPVRGYELPVSTAAGDKHEQRQEHSLRRVDLRPLVVEQDATDGRVGLVVAAPQLLGDVLRDSLVVVLPFAGNTGERSLSALEMGNSSQ